MILLSSSSRINYARVNGLDSDSSTSLIYSKIIVGMGAAQEITFFQNGDDCFVTAICKS